MKSFSTSLFAFLFACTALLTSCGETKENDPQPTVTAPAGAALVGTWNWTAARTVTTHANGAATTEDKEVRPGTVQLVFGADGFLQHVLLGVPSPREPYTVTGSTLVVNGGAPATITVTATTLVGVTVRESSGTRYTTTETYTR